MLFQDILHERYSRFSRLCMWSMLYSGFCNTAAWDLTAASCVALDRVPSRFIYLNNDTDVIKRLSQP